MTSDDAADGVVAKMEQLAEDTCWQLLATVPVGRVGFVVDQQPQILPVNFALDGHTLVFRTAEGTALNQTAMRNVAFEADHLDEEAREGWSVLVRGFARDIGNAIDPASDRLRRLSLVTWAPGQRHRWFRIDARQVTGRRLRVVPPAT